MHADAVAPRSPDARIAARLIGRLAATAGSTALGAALIAVESRLFGPSEARRAARVRGWGQVLLRAVGVHLQVQGEVPASAEAGGALVVCNHRSILDIPVVLSLVGGHMLSRGEVQHWPVFGKIAETAGTLFVDRQSAESGHGAVRQIRDLLRQGATVSVFPEGTTFSGDEVRPFREGAFAAALRARCRVLPIGLAYEDDGCAWGDESIGAHVKRVGSRPKTLAAVAIGPPIAVEGMRTGQLSRHARDEVQRLVREARRVLGSARGAQPSPGSPRAPNR